MKLHHLKGIKYLFYIRIIVRCIVRDLVTGIDSVTCPEKNYLIMCLMYRISSRATIGLSVFRHDWMTANYHQGLTRTIK